MMLHHIIDMNYMANFIYFIFYLSIPIGLKSGNNNENVD